MSRLPLQLLLFCCLTAGVGAQELWPGDVNRNGEVTAVDLLYWGIASGERGPERPAASTDWTAQPVGEAWAFDFADGTNYLYADTDGDGRVDRQDVEDALVPNLGRRQGQRLSDGFPNSPDTAALRLTLTPSLTVVTEGTALDIDLAITGATASTENFSGMALYLSYRADLLADLPLFELDPDGWIPGSDGDTDANYADDDGNYGGNGAVQFLFRRGSTPGAGAQLGVALNNRAPVAIEAGTLGSFRVIIEDIILGLTVDTFRMTVDSLMLTGDDITPLTIARGSTEILVARDTTGLSTTNENDDLFTTELTSGVYPNPTSGSLFFRSTEHPTNVCLTDAWGRRWPLSPPVAADGHYGIALPDRLPTGVYHLCLNYHGRAVSHRFLFVR